MTVFGGLAPVTVTWLIEVTGISMMLAFYQMMAAAVPLALVAGTARAVTTVRSSSTR